MQDSYFLYAQHVAKLPRASVSPLISASIRKYAEDFQVNERLSFEPSGSGEHLYFYIEKNNCNTDWVATQLQKHFQLKSKDIGYAGKKDRFSVSRQWFSVHLPGKNREYMPIENEFFKIIHSTLHNKKLRLGSIKENQFKLVLRNLSGEVSKDAVMNLAEQGFPNYFGYQRFGHGANNLSKAELLLTEQLKVKSRNKRGLYLSAARSFLFNLVLAKRVENKTWNVAIDGDCLNLNDTRSFFSCDKLDSEIQERVEQGDLHISGWLPGRQASQVAGDAQNLEQSILKPYMEWLQGLAKAKVDSARRPMRAFPREVQVDFVQPGELMLQFSLPSGCFATSLLRECFNIEDLALREILND
ncbi:tRNA pseudouridine(13) synthase TruD [Aliikangiella sp. IMCC44359]|uniref:tRNA pseudouridine(13) synthase TruD n=1 Tax=Aliikangiella sp. IMCC44359 TaxID=3459125 RepID=UPI00403AD4F8